MCLAKKHKNDFTTGRNRAVFWQTEKGKKSGVNSKNMEAAQRYAERANKMTLEMTEGGRIMDEMNLFRDDNGITCKHKCTREEKKKAGFLWNCASMWFAEEVTGDVDAFGSNARVQNDYVENGIPTFWNIELIELLNNNELVIINYYTKEGELFRKGVYTRAKKYWHPH